MAKVATEIPFGICTIDSSKLRLLNTRGIGYAEVFEHLHGMLHDFSIAVAAHDDEKFLHRPSLGLLKVRAIGFCRFSLWFHLRQTRQRRDQPGTHHCTILLEIPFSSEG